MEDQKYRLIVEYFEKTISDRGLTQLQEWIEESPENLETFSETIQILEVSKLYLKPAAETEKSWAHIHAHITKDEKTTKNISRKFPWLIYAAACLFICVSGLAWYTQMAADLFFPVEYAQISNPDGRHTQIRLPDSSIIHLGGGSRIRYAKSFRNAKRTIYLDGEAFFDVVHDAKRPFIVACGDISTVVLGTSFNIKAFSAEKKVAVTVQSGKVGVMSAVHGKSQLIRYLLPDEQMEINTKSGLYTFNRTDAAAQSAWIYNNFIFHNTALRDIAVSLEHRYGIKIEFTDPELGNTRLTAKFNNMPLKQVMDNISALSGLAYTQKDNQFFISNNNQKGGKL